MIQLKVYDKVLLTQTGDSKLDHELAVVLGFYSDGFVIVQFYDTPPEGYDPAIVISKDCLEPY